MKFNLVKACSNCPFRKDTLDGWLGEKRSIEILNSFLKENTIFPCHKTCNSSKGKERDIKKESACYGALNLLQKEKGLNSNFSIRLAKHLKYIKDENYSVVNNDELIDNSEEFIKKHSNGKGKNNSSNIKR